MKSQPFKVVGFFVTLSPTLHKQTRDFANEKSRRRQSSVRFTHYRGLHFVYIRKSNKKLVDFLIFIT